MATFKVLLGVFAIALIVGQIEAGNCPPGPWEYFNGNCYLFSYAKENYATGRDYCKGAYDGHVAIPRSAEELEFLTNEIFDRGEDYGKIWIGCDDNAMEGEFMCDDGAPISDDFNIWSGKQPNNGQFKCDPIEQENCVSLYYNGLLWDIECTKKRHIVCQIQSLA